MADKKPKPQPHPHYWKMKAEFLQRTNADMAARASQAAAAAKLRKAMVDAGLDPDSNYVLDDDEQSITKDKK